jgi:transposase
VDARVLAEFLALDMIPKAYRPTPRQRQHRALVRQRGFVKRCLTRVQNKIRRVLSDYNADRRDLFSEAGLAYLAELGQQRLSVADQCVVGQLLANWRHYQEQVKALRKTLKAFAQKAPVAEQEARAALGSAPGVGEVTVEVLLSEIGDVGRFSSAKKVVAYAGLAPGQRESAGRKKELPITKEGSRLLRWAMVQAAWRLVRYTKRWQGIFEQLSRRRGRKKAIVAVARRYLTVLVALWRKGECYRLAH